MHSLLQYADKFIEIHIFKIFGKNAEVSLAGCNMNDNIIFSFSRGVFSCIGVVCFNFFASTSFISTPSHPYIFKKVMIHKTIVQIVDLSGILFFPTACLNPHHGQDAQSHSDSYSGICDDSGYCIFHDNTQDGIVNQ